MKRVILLLMVLACSSAAMWGVERSINSDLLGTWQGNLNVGSTQLTINFQFTELEDGSFEVTMDSPDQGAFDIPVNSLDYQKPHLNLKIDIAGIEYNGTVEQNKISGTFTQMGSDFPLDLMRLESAVAKPLRPQDPTGDVPYRVEDVLFENSSAGIKLAGTFTAPDNEGPHPAVVLITGSGPQNRDEEIFAHKPFWILADHLTRAGVAVLRFDDRGVGESEGDFSSATSLDFATDVEAALAYLRSRNCVDKSKLGLIGHSEGGIIAPIVADKDPELAFIVLLAGPALPGNQIISMQQALIGKANGATDEEINLGKAINAGAFEILKLDADQSILSSALKAYLEEAVQQNPEITEGMDQEAFVKQQVDAFVMPWMRFFLNYDPAPVLDRLKIPVLALFGGKDLQVPAQENMDRMRQAFATAENEGGTIVFLENLNHLFQTSQTGNPSEYGSLEETFSPQALKVISDWILEQVR